MATKTRQELGNEIGDLCDQHGCSDKARKIHHAQFVDRQWNPHPPQRFVSWWGSHGAQDTEKQTGRMWLGIDAIRAFNCQAVREVYQEAKEYSIT